jgi:hypothetical protein
MLNSREFALANAERLILVVMTVAANKNHESLSRAQSSPLGDSLAILRPQRMTVVQHDGRSAEIAT